MSGGGVTPKETPIKIALTPDARVFGILYKVHEKYEMEIYTHGETTKVITTNVNGEVLSVTGPELQGGFVEFLEGIMARNGIEINATWTHEDESLKVGDTVPNWNEYVLYA